MTETKQKTKNREERKEKIINEIKSGKQEINYEILNKIKKEDRKALKKLAE